MAQLDLACHCRFPLSLHALQGFHGLLSGPAPLWILGDPFLQGPQVCRSEIAPLAQGDQAGLAAPLDQVLHVGQSRHCSQASPWGPSFLAALVALACQCQGILQAQGGPVDRSDQVYPVLVCLVVLEALMVPLDQVFLGGLAPLSHPWEETLQDTIGRQEIR